MNSKPAKNYQANILVVDDMPDNLRLLSALLSEQGYKVRKSLNAQMAITACETTPPDLILLDINMPDMNGYEACHHLKSSDRTREIPIIFISALDDIVDKAKAFDVGGADYITKPFQEAEVVLRIKNQLKLCWLENQLEEKNLLLAQTTQELQQAQIQIAQNQKIAALGKLVSEIADDLKDPIYRQIDSLPQYLEDLLYLIAVYQKEYPHPSPQVQSIVEKLNLDSIEQDIHNMMAAMHKDSDRFQQISLALSNFFELGESKLSNEKQIT